MNGSNGKGVLLEFTGPPISRIKGAEDGVQLFTDLETYYRKYVRVPEEAYPVLAAWVLHCHAFTAFTRTPYVHLSSPAPECGKTTLLEITELVVPKAWMTQSVSNAVLARKIEVDRPVLLIDEVDLLLAGDKELVSAVLQTINSGYKKSGCRTILIQVRGDWQPRDLSTFCPKMLAGLFDLPPATKSRCIPIVMERLGRGERVVEIDEFVTEPEANALFARAQDWAKAHLTDLRDRKPDVPSSLGHRQREVCRPLLGVADAAGGDCGERLRAALVKIFQRLEKEQPSDLKMLALTHVRDVLTAHAHDIKDHVRSVDLCTWLAEIEDGPWASWGKTGKPISQNQLARQLKGFASPVPVRIGDKTAKGYHVSALERAFERYLPPSFDSNRHTEAYEDDKGLNSNFEPKQTPRSFALNGEVSASASTNVSVSHFERADMQSVNAGGQQQQPDFTKEQSSEPTVSAGSVGVPSDESRTPLPSCQGCGSYYLYPTSDGRLECQTCGSRA